MVGAGEFGKVYNAEYCPAGSSNTRIVAVKVLTQQRVSSVADFSDSIEGPQSKFLAEARLLHALRHPNIIELIAVVTTEQPCMMVLEYMENGDLRCESASVLDRGAS